MLTLVAKDYFFLLPIRFCLCLWNLFFFLPSFLAGSAVSSRNKAGFGSLGLDFLEREEVLKP